MVKVNTTTRKKLDLMKIFGTLKIKIPTQRILGEIREGEE